MGSQPFGGCQTPALQQGSCGASCSQSRVIPDLPQTYALEPIELVSFHYSASMTIMDVL